jgi:hypothetical protein
MPQAVLLPTALPFPERFTPDEVQATSYFAASVRIVSFSIASIWYLPVFQYIEQMFLFGL